MLQPVGASAGMWPETRRLHQLALRLCRYDRPPKNTSRPVSYGWLDTGQVRFVFRRAFLPDNQAGHPGNFAAHILVGPRDELPAERILAASEATWWWTQPSTDDTVGELPVLTASDLWCDQVAAVTSANEVSGTVLATVLSGQPRVEVPYAPEHLLPAMGTIAARLPDLVEARSFSSYEASSTAQWFHICGRAETPNARAELHRDARAAADYVLGPVATRSRLARIWRDGPSDTLENVMRLRAIAAGLHSIHVARDLTAADLLPALQSPDAVDEILDHDRAQRAIAGFLIAGDHVVSAALRRHQRLVASDVWQRIGELIDSQLGAADVTASLAAKLDALPAELLVTLAAQRVARLTGPNQLSSITRWPLPLLRGALQGADMSRAPAVFEALMSAALRTDLPDWIGDSSLPIQARVQLVVRVDSVTRSRVLGFTELSPEMLAELLVSEPKTFAEACSAREGLSKAGMVITALEGMLRSPSSRSTPTRDQLDVLRSAVFYSSPGRGLNVILLASQAFCAKGYDWDQLVRTTVIGFLDRLLSDPHQPHSDTLALAAAASPTCALWRPVVSSTAPSSLDSSDVAAALRAMTPADRRRGAAFIVDAAVSRGVTSYQQLLDCQALLLTNGLDPPRMACVLLTAAARAAFGPRYFETVRCVLEVVGDMVVDASLGLPTATLLPFTTRHSGEGLDQQHGVGAIASRLYRDLKKVQPEIARQLTDRYAIQGRLGRQWNRAMTSHKGAQY